MLLRNELLTMKVRNHVLYTTYSVCVYISTETSKIKKQIKMNVLNVLDAQ